MKRLWISNVVLNPQGLAGGPKRPYEPHIFSERCLMDTTSGSSNTSGFS